MTEREEAVAAEIVRIAREDLRLVPPLGGTALRDALDSLSLLALVVAVEDRFRVALHDEDAACVSTLEDLARLVAGRADPDAWSAPGAAPP